MSTVDYTQIDGTLSGPQITNAIALEFQHADTELDARPKKATAETITGAWTFSATLTASGALNVTGDLTANSGVGMGSGYASGVTDLTRHLALYGTAYGANVTSGFLNFVANSVNGFSMSSTALRSKLNHDFDAGIDVTGNISVTGTVDGRDIASDGSKLDTIAANAVAAITNASDLDSTSQTDGYILQWDSALGKYKHVVKPTTSGSESISITHQASTVTVSLSSDSDIIDPVDTNSAGVMTSSMYNTFVSLQSLLTSAVEHADFATNGVLVRTSSGNYTGRSLVAGQEISISNADGTGGNPTIALSRNITVSTSGPSGGSDGDLWFEY